MLQAQLISALSSARRENVGGKGTTDWWYSREWTEVCKGMEKKEMVKGEESCWQFPLPIISGILYLLLCWLLHYKIKSWCLLLRDRKKKSEEVRGHDLY